MGLARRKEALSPQTRRGCDGNGFNDLIELEFGETFSQRVSGTPSYPASGRGSGDSGVTSRMFGTFLSWLNDHESDVFVVCTANDVSKLPPEFGRSERFDGIFFLDLPSDEEKALIWSIYLDLYEINRDQRMPVDNLSRTPPGISSDAKSLSDCQISSERRSVILVSYMQGFTAFGISSSVSAPSTAVLKSRS